MPRSKSELPGGVRVSDLALLGVLAEHIPSWQILAAVERAGRQSIRRRDLPAEVTALYVVALSVFSGVSTEEVLACFLESWRMMGLAAPKLVTKGGITQARTRLGKEVLKDLFERLALPLAVQGTAGWYRDWRTVAFDGSTLAIPDSEENARKFGYAGDASRASYPLLRFECLIETGTHAPLAASLGPYAKSEKALAQEILGALKADMLLLADRAYLSADFWQECRATGADLLWRATSSWPLVPIKNLKDGSYLAELGGKSGPKEPITVRVIEYEIEGESRTSRLVTSILDPVAAPAKELLEIYCQRWEIETAFDEMKTHLRGRGALLRSRTTELVEQEFWGLMIAHRTLRALMYEASLLHNKDPDEISFVGTLRIVRRTLSSRPVFSPSETPEVAKRDPE